MRIEYKIPPAITRVIDIANGDLFEYGGQTFMRGHSAVWVAADGESVVVRVKDCFVLTMANETEVLPRSGTLTITK